MLETEMGRYQSGLLKDLYWLRSQVASAKSELIKIVLDDKYFYTVEEEVRKWCEDNQHRRPIPSYSAIKGGAFLILSDRLVPGEFERFDEAISKLEKTTRKRKKLRKKVEQILESHPALQATVFEIYCLAEFANAVNNVELIDIDFKHRIDSEQNVDGLIRINERGFLLEATYISKSLVEPLSEQRQQFYKTTGKDIDLRSEVGTLDIEEMIAQVTNKANGKLSQIGNTTRPAILAIALPHFGADFDTAGWALEECFTNRRCDNIGCVIISGSYLLKGVRIFFNDNARYPFLETEKSILNAILE